MLRHDAPMSAAPQEAVAEADPETRSRPEPGSAGYPVEAAPASAEAAPPAPAAPEPETVDIWGKKVLVSELVALFDRDCRHRCAEGVLKVMRPRPKPFKGTMPVREICACCVMRYAQDNPPELSGGLSAEARAALKAAEPSSVPRGDAPAAAPERAPGAGRLSRLREQLARESTALMAIRAARTEKTAVLERELAEVSTGAAARAAAEDSRAGRRASALVRKEDCVRALHAIELILVDLEREEEAAVASAAPAAARAAELTAEIERVSASSADQERAPLRRIEDLEGRVRIVLIRHPELVDG